jgi:type I restriction enzyme, S subunit
MKSYEFGELVQLWIDNRGKTPPLSSSGFPLIEIKDITGDGIFPNLDDTKFVSQTTYDSWFRNHLQPMDILFSTVGTTGQVAMVPESPHITIAQNVLGIRFREDLADSKYMYFLMKSWDFQHEISARLVTTVQGSIKRSDMVNIKINLPSLTVQKRIAAHFSSIVHLIDERVMVNSNLSKIASLLFRSWFIDFDPVKAKSEGKLPYGMDEETAALFSDSFQDSEIGPIPSGWKLCSILELGDFLNGVASQKYPVTSEDDSLPVVKIREMQNGVTEKSDWASTSTPQKYHINEGDVLFSWAATLLVQHWQGNKAILNQHIFKVTPSENFPEWFVYQYLTSELWKFQRMATAGETMMGHIKRKDLQQHLIVIPPNQLLKKLSETMNPLYSLSKSISINQKHTTSIRDALLPKLMSGELSVS